MADTESAQEGASPGTAPEARSPPLLIYLVTAAALLFGLWARFKGLGTWPLIADEYYIARSVQNILKVGLPEYACGGYYTRGLIFQYVVALLQAGGMSAELSGRLIAAVSSLVALPAVYLLGVRVHGRTVGLIAVAVLAVSTWEVDIARFGRMYAPFQAVFAWYLVYFIRYTVDREARALWPMLILSIAGFFTWEGGIFLLAANLLPPFIRSPAGAFAARDVRFLAFAAILVALAYFFMQIPFRTLGTEPFPAGFVTDIAQTPEASYPALFEMSASGPARIITMLVLVVLGIAVIGAARWIWSLRPGWPGALGMVAALGCALAGQFSAVAFILAILLLGGMLDWRELRTRAALPFTIAVAGSAVAWTTALLRNPSLLSAIEAPWGESSRALLVAYELLRFPDFVGVVALPWARSAPSLGATLFVLIALASLRVIGRERQQPAGLQVTLVLLVSLLAAASLSNPPRFETRYVFFLYPAAVVIAVAMVAEAVKRWLRNEVALAVATLAIVAAGLALTGDFQPRRLLAIDSAAMNFGLDLGPDEKSNTLNGSDTRGAAQWLAANTRDPGT
ncbi:MAG: glycosyltransferase family 39 protein, partial [Steroidobacteraceae bacterium]